MGNTVGHNALMKKIMHTILMTLKLWHNVCWGHNCGIMYWGHNNCGLMY